MGRFALIFLALLLAGRSGLAHQGGVTGYAAVSVQDNVLRYRLTLSQLPPAVLAAAGGDAAAALERVRNVLSTGLLVDNAGEACAAANARAEPFGLGKESVAVEVDIVCRDRITQLGVEDRSFAVLGNDLHTLARITWPGGESQFAFAAETPRLSLEISAPQTAAAAPSAIEQGVGSFLRLGFFHILKGYDHLMFLLALLLVPAGGWAVVRVITAFTVAHSLTLALTALGWLSLPSLLVETAIALSIAYVAAENLWRGSPGSHRELVSGLLGLIHGCGFADLLRETGLPRDHLVGALFGFNVGVEIGQLAVVLAVLPTLVLLSKTDNEPRVRRGLSLVLLATGLLLAAVRLAS